MFLSLFHFPNTWRYKVPLRPASAAVFPAVHDRSTKKHKETNYWEKPPKNYGTKEREDLVCLGVFFYRYPKNHSNYQVQVVVL